MDSFDNRDVDYFGVGWDLGVFEVKMSNDEGLVDEFEELENLKKEIEQKEHELRVKIIDLAKQRNTSVLFGKNKKCSLTEYVKVIYPENKDFLIKIIKEKGLYQELSQFNYSRISARIVKNELDADIASLVKKQKEFKLTLKDI